MAIPNRTKLQRYFAELQRLEETRSMGAEKEIQKAYKAMLKDLRQFLGEEYGKYAVDDALTYSTLAQKGQYARFLEEVQKKVNGITPRVNSAITKVVKETYRMAYEGMVQAVAVAVNDKQLEQLLSGIHLTEAEVIKAAVNNPVSKLTLSKTLEKNRKQIVHNIKQTVTVGIMNGDRMSTMAKKIQADVDQNYRKAMLIARTEVHRVRETGHNDGAASVDNILAEENYDYRMVKVWKSMRDASVRKTSKADHRKMNGQTVLQDEDFKLGRGVTAPCPGQSGTAYNDCNCRCYVSHDLMSDSEFFQATGRHFKEVEKPKKAKTPKKKEPVQPTVEPKADGMPKLTTGGFPDKFNQRTAKKQTQKFVDYVNSIEGADGDIISIYGSMGKLENIERNGIPFKISYTKDGHAVNYTYRRTTHELVEASIRIPKLDGDDIRGAAQTTAHELGHYIDMLCRSDADKYDDWISASKGMSKAIDKTREGMSDEVSELFKSANQRIEEIRKRITDEYDKKIKQYRADNMSVIENMYYDYTSYKEYQKQLRKLYAECEERRDYETRNMLNGISSLQDIYDALSKGKYRDTGVVKYGHGARYYRTTENQIHEIWANYCALSLTRPDLIDMLRRDKPDLVAALDEIKAEILKKVGRL